MGFWSPPARAPVRKVDPPGGEYGPCRAPNCNHPHCTFWRQMAVSACAGCGKPIGFGREATGEPTGPWTHKECG